MTDQLAKRDATQPTKDRTVSSTFRNPAGFRQPEPPMMCMISRRGR